MKYRSVYSPDDAEKPKFALFSAIASLWPYLWRYKYRVIIAFSLLILAKVATVTMPWVLKQIVDSLDLSLSPQLILPLSLLLLYGSIRFATVFLGEARDAIFSRVTERTLRLVGLKAFQHLHSLDLEFHLGRQTGGVARDIERGSSGIRFLLRMLVFNILPTLFELIMVAAILFVNFDIWLAILTVVSVTIYVVFTVVTTEWRNKFVREANMLDSKSNSRAIDSLLNYETVKYFNNEQWESDNYDKDLAQWETARLKNRMSLAALNSGQALIVSAAVTLMMVLVADDVVNGTLTLGDLVMVNAYLIQLFIPLNFLGFAYREIRRATTDIENLFDLMARKPAISDKPNAQDIIVDKGEIVFHNLNFSYDGKRTILNNINFKVGPGEKVALVGHSGSGKSTLARLLYRFYDPDGGNIAIDGYDISQVTQDSVRKHIGVVPQDTVLFNDSIFMNVSYGDPKADSTEVWEAIRQAHLSDFIQSLPDRENTIVGERGLKLSGGEKQRIAIARALLKKPEILMFDEATSALDSATEQSILHAMKEVSMDRTTLVIAHRLSTIVDADRILVMDAGRIVESGSHIELLAVDGLYASLWEKQQYSDNNESS